MAPPVLPIAERIKSRVSVNERGCWIWNGPIFKDGYGAIGIRRTGAHRAHRVSYSTFVGPIPDGLWVLHRCDTPACVNPEHLFIGTAKDNAADKEAKGRSNRPCGAKHHSATHSERFVWAVRRLDKAGVPIKHLAEMYGHSYGAMHQLCRGNGWKCFDPEAISLRVFADWRKA